MELNMFLASMPYYEVIGISVVIIISYLFNILSKKTNIPSVLMLIVLGVIIKMTLDYFDQPTHRYDDYLEIIGIIGLIMIVLEAALDLELSKENWPIIWKSFAVALSALVLSALLVAGIIYYFGIKDFYAALVYAVPLSIMSSAIIIPSVGGLSHHKKEFMVYESTFSDILGIMFFFFLTGAEETDSSTGGVIGYILLNITVTVLVAGVASYVLVIIFQKLTSHIKLFLLIAVLLLLYAIGKLLGLSSLVIILVFGLLLNNRELFFKGRLAAYLNHAKIERIEHDFRLVTLESAFVVRTFFFVIFGLSIDFDELKDPMVALQAGAIVGALFLVRWIVLKIFVQKDIVPQVFIAPRGLITILLFFSISHSITDYYPFDSGILLYSIIITALVMTWSLISSGKRLEHVDEEYNQSLEENAGLQISLLGRDNDDFEAESETALDPYGEPKLTGKRRALPDDNPFDEDDEEHQDEAKADDSEEDEGEKPSQ